MTAFCQPLRQPVAEEMLQVVARAVCDRPGDSGAQRESRTRQMVLTTLGFEPRDGLEYMLSTLAFGHFELILDSMNDVFQGQVDTMKAKTKTTIVALDRVMLQIMKELRAVRRRPMARSAKDARQEAASPATAPSPAQRPPPRDPPAPEPATATTARSGPDAGARPAASGPAEGWRDAPVPAKPGQTMTQTAEANRADAESALVVPARAGHLPVLDTAMGERRLTASMDGHADAVLGTRPNSPPPETDAGTAEGHIAAFEAALAAVIESLTGARALNGETATAASGD